MKVRQTGCSYYDDRWWCPRCMERMNYLSGPDGNYCARCGGRVRMFRSPKERREAGFDYPWPDDVAPSIERPPKPRDRGNRPA